MQDKQKQSNATLGIILVIVGALLLMMYLASNNNAEVDQREEATTDEAAPDVAATPDPADTEQTEVPVEPETPAVRGPADPAVITNTLTELEQDFGESYDDSNVDASFEDQTGDLTDSYAF